MILLLLTLFQNPLSEVLQNATKIKLRDEGIRGTIDSLSGFYRSGFWEYYDSLAQQYDTPLKRKLFMENQAQEYSDKLNALKELKRTVFKTYYYVTLGVVAPYDTTRKGFFVATNDIVRFPSSTRTNRHACVYFTSLPCVKEFINEMSKEGFWILMNEEQGIQIENNIKELNNAEIIYSGLHNAWYLFQVYLLFRINDFRTIRVSYPFVFTTSDKFFVADTVRVVVADTSKIYFDKLYTNK